MPTIVLSTINVLVPEITKILMRNVEAWDYEEYRIKQEIWRNFCIKFINLGAKENWLGPTVRGLVIIHMPYWNSPW